MRLLLAYINKDTKWQYSFIAMVGQNELGFQLSDMIYNNDE